MNKSITDEKIIAVLLASDTRKKACKTLGIKEQTLYDRMSKPDFQVKYKQARDEIIKQVTDRISSEITEAISVISEIMHDNNNSPQIRLNASDCLLRHGIRLIEQRDIIERIEKLEAIYASERG